MFLLPTVLFDTCLAHGPGRRGAGAVCPARSQQPIGRHGRCVRKPEEQASRGERACSGQRSRDPQGCGDSEGEGLGKVPWKTWV